MTPSSPPASERAYRATKDQILSGRLPAGTLLSEGEIAEQLRLSRTPVREAFLRLEAEQLLRLIPKRGALVVPVPATEAADVLEVRFALETGAARRLAAIGELAPVLARLDRSIEEQSRSAAGGDLREFAAADEQFHRAIVAAAGNAIAERFYATLGDRQRRMTIGAVGARPGRVPDLVREHRELRERIAERDVAGFASALLQHLQSTHNLFFTR